jgi:glycosyltransferase involved in cell wall biosynthesis
MRMLVVFTYGMSLTAWDQAGILHRELALYERLTQLGASVTLLTYGGKTDLELCKDFPGLRVLTNHLGLPTTIFSIVAPFLYAREFRAADILKTNQINGWWTAWISWLFSRAPLILRCGYLLSLNYRRKHGENLMSSILTYVERLGFLVADLVIVTTPEMKQHIVRKYGLPDAKVQIVPNYVDTDMFSPGGDHQDRHGKRLCFVGTLKEAKNPLGLVSAMGKLADPSVELLMVGEGPLRPQVEEAARSLGTTIRFLGTIPNEQLPDVLRGCGLFILPSLWEGHPKALLEAMSCGMAVLGCNSPGIRDIILEGVNGCLCAPDPDSMAYAIGRLLNDTETCTRLGKAAREYAVSNYSLERIASLELSMYSEVAR